MQRFALIKKQVCKYVQEMPQSQILSSSRAQILEKTLNYTKYWWINKFLDVTDPSLNVDIFHTVIVLQLR